MMTRLLIGGLIGSFCGGCSSYYTPPGRAADFAEMGIASADHTPSSISAELARRPLARFPTAIAVARVQAAGYRSETATEYGTGVYCVITNRDVESPEQIDRLAKLPGVTGLAPLNRLLLKEQLQSDLDLRQAAARLHADILLIYTFDTQFMVDDKLAPLSVVTLGLSPNQWASAVCTASAVLLDTRNGYLYGLAEQTSKQGQLASAWTSEAAVDDTRRRAEREAFVLLVGELEKTWVDVYRNYATPVPAAAAPPAWHAPAPRPAAAPGEWRLQ